MFTGFADPGRARRGIQKTSAQVPLNGRIINPQDLNRRVGSDARKQVKMEAHKKEMLERKLRELMRQADKSPDAARAPLKPKTTVTRVIRRRKGTPDRVIA